MNQFQYGPAACSILIWQPFRPTLEADCLLMRAALFDNKSGFTARFVIDK